MTPPVLLLIHNHDVGGLIGITHACSQFSDVSPPAVNGYFWRPARNLRCAAIGHTACDCWPAFNSFFTGELKAVRFAPRPRRLRLRSSRTARDKLHGPRRAHLT